MLTRLFEELTAQKITAGADVVAHEEDDLDMLHAVEPEEDEISDDFFEDDYASNAPCDFSGYCSGTSCPHFFKCKGS